ncbi:SDR family NAD(P)-dependent oxidoreductase [Planktotalea arctica]|uniref:SDR family NAD(P)-dependent oxidoreductase n=1 Tax=Planktotalea arctica TaxID=1481893 RepID=UPI00321A95F7
MKTAVISGGAGGLGRALTARLITQGWHVVALDIDISALELNDRLSAYQVDLTDGVALDDTVAEILDAHTSIDLVIYNAGVSQIASFEDTKDAAHRRLFDINYFAATALARGFLAPLRASKGTHLAISSVAGFSPLYHRTAYAASKHALQGFFASLRSEEAEHGVRTLIAAPSFVATNIGNAAPMNDGMLRPGSARDGLDYMTPDAAAKIILAGYAKGRPFIPVGRIARLSWWINALSPRLFQRLMERNIKGA